MHVALLLLLLLCTGARAQAPAAPDTLPCPTDGLDPGRGQVCVRLVILEGRLAIDTGSVFVARSLPPSLSEEVVFGRLRSLLQGLELVCDVQNEGRSRCLLPADAELKACAGDTTAHATWADYWSKVFECGGDFSLLDRLRGMFASLAPDSPFVLGTDEDAFQSEPGFVRWQVVAFTRNTPIDVHGPLGPTKRLSSLRSALAPLEGDLWDAPRIAATVARFYRPLGLQPQVFASIERQVVEIIEAPQIRDIALPSATAASEAARRRTRAQAAYLLLDDRDFARWINGPKDGDSIAFVRDLKRAPGDEPFWIEAMALRQRTALGALAMDLQKVPAGTRVQNPAIGTVQQLVTARVVDQNAPDSGSGSAEKRKSRFIGVELAYKPGQGTSAGVVLRQGQLPASWADFSVGLRLGRSKRADTLVGLDVSADFIGFETLKHRLSLTAGAADDTTPGRYLNGAVTQERRQGQRANVEFELFHSRDGQRWTWQLERTAVEVSLAPDSPGAVAQSARLSSWSLSSTWSLEAASSQGPWRVMLRPSWLVGRVSGLGETYRKTRLNAAARYYRGSQVLDVAATLQRTSAGTPVFEQPSLGGAESVRGFAVDDAIGRDAWTLQSELWWPLPRAGGPAEGLLSSLRAATFVDFAGLRQPAAGSTAGTRRGAGLGLRLLFQPAVIKLDYAWGRGPASRESPRGRFYFSFTTDVSL